jgi:hypothetical protein
MLFEVPQLQDKVSTREIFKQVVPIFEEGSFN